MSPAAVAFTGNDDEVVRLLLGRAPRLPYVVATRCPGGTPQVLQADPVFREDKRWKPFPTIYWLVCPRLKKAVARLEQEGGSKMFTQRLRDDRPFREEYLAGQRELIAFRLGEARRLAGDPLPPDVEAVLSEANIAGSRDSFGVKCLHAHLAHTLAGGRNPIGRAVLERIGLCRADPPCLPGPAGPASTPPTGGDRA